VSLPFGRQLPHVISAVPGPRSRSLTSRLGEVESRNVTFHSSAFPVFWEEARGANVRDVDGNVYLDLTAAFGVAAAGHAHPSISAAIASQAERLIHGMGDVHPPALKVELMERLLGLAPWPEGRGVLANSGSEAVEIALKTSLLASGKPGILAFEGGYHGLTLGALGVTHRNDFRLPFQARLYPGVCWAPFPLPGRHGPGAGPRALEEVRRLLAAGAPNGDPIGAVLVEPIQGRGGVRVPPPGFLSGLAEVTRQAGAVLIFDEILTGFGRTGAHFAFQHEGVIPDVLCVGKALGGGLPLSACLGSREVMDAWPPSTGEALHTSTFLGHPLACASALAFLDVLEAEELDALAARKGTRLLERLRRGLEGSPVVKEVRGRGLLVGIELEQGTSRGGEAGAGVALALEGLRKGLLLLPAGEAGEVLELAPPLIVTDEQVDTAVQMLTELVGAHAVVGAGLPSDPGAP
jgi:4-aminobutyrate aminotransferase-like enzyme